MVPVETVGTEHGDRIGVGYFFFSVALCPLLMALFVSVYNPILDGNKPKSHPNVLIIFRFCRSPLPTESSEQRRTRFSPKRPRTRVPGNRATFPQLPSLPTPVPCAPSPPPLSLRRLCSGSGVPHPCPAVRRRPGTARPSSHVPAAARCGGGCRSRNTRCCLFPSAGGG